MMVVYVAGSAEAITRSVGGCRTAWLACPTGKDLTSWRFRETSTIPYIETYRGRCFNMTKATRLVSLLTSSVVFQMSCSEPQKDSGDFICISLFQQFSILIYFRFMVKLNVFNVSRKMSTWYRYPNSIQKHLPGRNSINVMKSRWW